MKMRRCPECNSRIPADCNICDICWDNLPLGDREHLIPGNLDEDDEEISEFSKIEFWTKSRKKNSNYNQRFGHQEK